METSKLKTKISKRVSAILLAAMVVGVGFSGYSEKAEATVPTKVEYVECKTASTYTKTTAPKAVDIAPELGSGYLFAGWFKDDKGNTAYKADENVAGVAYAKFVPAQVLSVKTQVDDQDKTVGSSTNIRIVSSVDSLDYSKIGFKISAVCSDKVTREWSGSSSKVFKKYTADGRETEADAVFGDNSAYFFSYLLTSIPTTDEGAEFGTSFYATPYWITMDGTTVEGLTKCVHVEDYYKDYVSVPVYLQSKEDVEVAAGILSVAYDTNYVEYVDCQNGSLLEEGMANGSSGTVKCVANVDDISNNVPADGMFINLRFKPVKDNSEDGSNVMDPAKDGLKNKPKGGYTFAVTVPKDSFCNVAEDFVAGVTPWDSFYY